MSNIDYEKLSSVMSKTARTLAEHIKKEINKISDTSDQGLMGAHPRVVRESP